ncbi:hypothetical protein ACER0C_012021 [Sarotherodon galilaeus]
MAAEDTGDYQKVKEAIFSKYDINEEVYRQRFRDPDIRPGESPKEFYNRLKDLYGKWIQPEKKTKEQVGDAIILEQFYRSLTPELQVWVKERGPKSAQEAAQLVETFQAAWRGARSFRFGASAKSFTSHGKSSGVGGGPKELESLKSGDGFVKTKLTTKPAL